MKLRIPVLVVRQLAWIIEMKRFQCVVWPLVLALPSLANDINPVIQWNTAAVQALCEAKLGAPMAARALAIVHTCMYDA